MKRLILSSIVLLFFLSLSDAALAQDSLGVTKISAVTNVWGQPGKVAYQGSYVYVPTGISGLRIVDVSNPTQPRETGFIETEGNALWADVQGDYCYVADELRGVRIIDVTDPVEPVEVGFYNTDSRARAVVVRDTLCYVADNSDGLRILSIADPANPYEVGYRDTDGATVSLALSGNYCYIVDVGLRVIDISEPTDPREVVHITTPGAGKDLAIEGNFCYFADGVLGVKVFDISEPLRPRETGMLRTRTSAVGISVFNKRMYVATGLGCFHVICAEDSSRLYEAGYYLTYGLSYTVQARDNIALLSDGFSLYLLDCSVALSAPVSPLAPQPSTFVLGAPYPNPFNSTVTIPFRLPSSSSSSSSLSVYDASGRQIDNLPITSGSSRAVWRADGVGAGTYFVRLQDEGVSQNQRLELVR